MNTTDVLRISVLIVVVVAIMLATQPAVQAILLADINDSGSVDAIDVQLVINSVLGLNVDYECDLNNSGSVDAVDVQLVINYALGIGPFVGIEDLQSGLTAYILDECKNTSYIRWLDTSITTDSQGRVHLLYKSTERLLAHVFMSDSGWVIEKDILQSSYAHYGSGCGGNNAMVMDQHDKIHISLSYSDGCDEDLLYLTNSSGEWVTENVCGGASVGLENDIVVDGNGNAYIIHWAWQNDNLLLTSNVFGKWKTETLDDGGVSWHPNSILLDSSGAVHVIYARSGKLLHMTNSAGDWAEEELPSFPRGGVSAVIKDGSIHAVTSDTLLSYNGEIWVQEGILRQLLPDIGAYDIYIDEDALGIDMEGCLHMCFLTQTGSYNNPKQLSVFYASNILGDWEIKLVDQWMVDDYNDFAPCLAIDKVGDIHIGYVKSDDYRLRYTSFNPWEFIVSVPVSPIQRRNPK